MTKPTSRSKKYEDLSATVDDAGWSRWVWPAEVYKISCCDCGLVHQICFRIDDDGDIAIAFRRHNRATAQVRWNRRTQLLYVKGTAKVTQTYLTLLVGAHFRPPAKLVLAHLPAGALLTLVPEPDNPYDEKAIKVFANPQDIPESEHAELEAELPLAGSSLDELLSQDEIWLGYVAASSGKPLANRPDLVGNSEVLAALTQADVKSSLQFGGQGEPLIKVQVGED